jgi:ribose/xylose/arabinose/galactoside ABC-type transport system permease subunit
MAFDRFQKTLAEQAILIILAGLFLLCSLFVPSFFTARNLVNILKQSAIIGIVAAGLTVTMIAGNVDLSVGSTVAFSGILALLFTHTDFSKAFISGTSEQNAVFLALAILLPLLLGGAVGLFNGMVVTGSGANSVIITLGALAAVRGGALLFSDGKVIYGAHNPLFDAIGQAQIATIPIYVFFFLVFVLLLEALLRFTTFGRSVYHIGTNLKASVIAGIPVSRVRVTTFVICGFAAGVAAVILAARLNSASGTTANGWEFDAVTAVVIGGTSLFGGKGSVLGTLLGTLLVTLIINAMVLLNIPSPWQYVAKALIIVTAVLIDVRTRKEAI